VTKLLERECELAALEELLSRGSGLLAIEAGIGLGKTSLIHAACEQAQQRRYQVLRAHGSELETEFALGVARQLLEWRLVSAKASERERLFVGPTATARSLLFGESIGASPDDTSFAVLHGLYWLTANLSAERPLVLTVDDAHWADEPSLRWLVYLARRLEGLRISLLVAFRPQEPRFANAYLLELRRQASMLLHPGLLSKGATKAIVRAALGDRSSDQICEALCVASGGNPLYLAELLRGVDRGEQQSTEVNPAGPLASGLEEIGRAVVARVRSLDPSALRFAQALAVLGDSCPLRHAAIIAKVTTAEAIRLAVRLVHLEVLANENPPSFIHPVVHDALEASIAGDERDAVHRAAARLLHEDGAPAGRIAAHLISVRPVGDPWVLRRLQDAAHQALDSGAPKAAAELLNRALIEPPSGRQRIDLLRQTARAEASAGREAALLHLNEAARLTPDHRERAEIALEVAEVYAAMFRWADAVDTIGQGLAELGEADAALAGRLEGALVVCGLHDARCAAQVKPVLERLCSALEVEMPTEPLSVAQGMALALAGRPAEEAAPPLEYALANARSRAENWDTRAALLWSLVTIERFRAVENALEPMIAEVHHAGSARGFVATCSTLGLLKLRLGALPEADSAARVALRVLQEGDFRPGLAFAATVLADIAIEAGELDEAESLLALLPQEGWPAGVGTVLIPAARGRLRFAQNRPAEALLDFQRCAVMFGHETWGIEIRDVGYLHARAGAAKALLHLGQRDRARDVAQAELVDARVFGAPRALGVALRTAGLTQGGSRGLELLGESVTVLRNSPALLERAHSLAELGAALRRDGYRAAAREPLIEALDLAARCGARPLIARVREELKATGARPRREWRTGLEALSPRELHVVRLAAEGRSNREIAHQLYVTLKTIEGHLARAYAKLGVERRSQLAPILEQVKTRVPTR
jgi:DNA-binding CsgD family transcriptional regulator